MQPCSVALLASLMLTRLCAQTLPSVRPLPGWAGRYEQARPSENVFIVSKGGKMAVATLTGQLLTHFDYDTIYNFREGMAVVGRGHRDVNAFGKVLSDFKYGYLSKTGRLVVPMNYEYVNDFSEGFGLIVGAGGGHVYGGRFGYVYVNKTGKPVLNPKPVYRCDSFRGNLAYVLVPEQGMWLPPYVGPGYAPRKQEVDIDDKYVYGNYIDRQGRLLIPAQYDTIAPYYPGYVRAVRRGGRWGFLDSLATVAVPLQYDDIDADSTHYWHTLRRVGIGGRYGFMDPRTGRLVIRLHYEDTKPSQSALVWVRQGGRWGGLDARSNVAISPQYDDAQPFEPNGLAAVQQAGKWGLIDTAGKRLAPTQYDLILPFCENRAVVRRDGRFGFLDQNGQEVIPAEYVAVSPFAGGQAFAKRWGLLVTLDPGGHWIGLTLQRVTLKWLSFVLAGFVVLGWFWTKRQRTRLLNKPV